MKLIELLRVISHQNYSVYVQNDVTNLFGESLKLDSIEDILSHADYNVLSINDNFNIILQESKIV